MNNSGSFQHFKNRLKSTMPLKKFYHANTSLFINMLDRVIVSKLEASILLFIYHIEQLAIFLSPQHNWPQSNITGLFSWAQDIFKILNLRYILEWITIPIDSLLWISFITLFSLLVFASYVQLLVVHFKEVEEIRSRYLKTLFSFILWTAKYSTFILTIPILQTCFANLAGPLPNKLLAALSLFFFFSFSLVEKIFFEEDGFLESNYLCKTASNQKIYDFFIMIVVIVSETWGNTDLFRLLMTMAMVVFFLFQAWRVLNWDYFYMTWVQKIHIGFIGAKLPFCFYLMITSILQLAGVKEVYDAPFGVVVFMGLKIVWNIQQKVDKDLLRNSSSITSSNQADRYMKFLVNISTLYKRSEAEMFNYSDDEVYSNINPLYHFGMFSNSYYRDYMNFDSILMAKELYDPLICKPYIAKELTDQEMIIKQIPKDVILFKHFVKDLYLHFTHKFPKSDVLHLSFASFLLYYLRHTHLVILQCFHLKKLRQDTNIKMRTEFSRTRILKTVNKLQESLDVTRKEDDNYTNLDIKGVRDFEQRYISFTGKINNFVKKHYEFLDQLSQENISLDNLYHLGSELTILLSNIKKDYKNHLSGSPLATQIYAQFQSLILMDRIEAVELNKQLQSQMNKIEMYNRLEKDFYEIELMFNKHASIIQIGAHSENLGKIVSVNEGCIRLFGYQAKELELANVNVIMPRLLRFHHDSFLRNYFETGKETILYREQRSFGRNRDGYIFPLSLLVKPMVNLETSQFLFIAYLRSLQSSNEFIISDQYGCVDGISEKLAKSLGISSNLLDSHLVLMQLICPELALLFNLKPMKESDPEGQQNDEIKRGTKRMKLRSYQEIKSIIESREETVFDVILRNKSQDYCVRLGELLPKNAIEFHMSILEHQQTKLTNKIEKDFEDQLSAGWNETKKNYSAENTVPVSGHVSEFVSSRGSVKWYIFRFVGIENLDLNEKKHRTMADTNGDPMYEPKGKTLTYKTTAEKGKLEMSYGNLESFKGTEIPSRSELASLKPISSEKVNKLDIFVKSRADNQEPLLEQDENSKLQENEQEEDLSDNSESDRYMSKNRDISVSYTNPNPRMLTNLSLEASTIIQQINGFKEEFRDTAGKGFFTQGAGEKGHPFGTQGNPLESNYFDEAKSDRSLEVFNTVQKTDAMLNNDPLTTQNGFNTPKHRSKGMLDSQKSHTLTVPSKFDKFVRQNKSMDVSDQHIGSKLSSMNLKSDLEKKSHNNNSSGGETPGKNRRRVQGGRHFDGSVASSATTTRYEFRALRNAIRNEYVPKDYQQAKFLAFGILTIFLSAFVGITAALVVSFQNLKTLPFLVSNMNRISYEVHRLGGTSFHLSLLDQLPTADKTAWIGANPTELVIGNDVAALRNSVDHFKGNHTSLKSYYGDISNVTTQIISVGFSNVSVTMNEFFYTLLLKSTQVAKDYAIAHEQKSSTELNPAHIEDLSWAYNNIYDPLMTWVSLFLNTNSLSQPSLSASLIKAISICSAIFLLSILLAYKLNSATTLINTAVFQLTYLSSSELTHMKERIIVTKKFLEGLDLGSEMFSISKAKEKNQLAAFKAGKRRVKNMQFSFLRRTLPTIGIALTFIGIQIFIDIIDSVLYANIRQPMLNQIFFSNEDMAIQRAVALYKNYTEYQFQTGLNNDELLQGILETFNDEIETTSANYQAALSIITETQPEDKQQIFREILYTNICNHTNDTQCPTLLDGNLAKGLVSAKIGLFSYMIKTIGNLKTATENWEIFEVLRQSAADIHAVLDDIIDMTITQTGSNIELIRIVLISIIVAIPIACLLLFRLYWFKCFHKLKKELLRSRQLLQLIPIPYILGNSRLKNYVETTSSVLLK